ncbi:MAG: ABC transporter substrate-binding protein [Erysipelotrichaceae bacterium]
MKKILVVLLILLVLVGCGGSANTGVVIGFNFELTGAVADYGQMEEKGASLAAKLANDNGGVLDQEINVITVDNQSELTEVVSATTKLATMDNAVAIIGPATSGNSAASFESASQNATPNISPSATADGVTMDGDGNLLEYAFSLSFQDSYQGSVMGKFAIDNMQAKKAVIFSDNSSDYAKGLADNFETYFTENGGSIVSVEAYTAGETDFNAVLTNIASMDFDILFVPGYYAEVGLIIRQARAMGIDKPILGGDGYGSPELVNLATEEHLNNVYYSTGFNSESDSQVVKDFISAFEAEYNESPGSFAALAYDATNLLIDAIERAGSTDREAVKEAIAATESFVGVTGTVSFAENHTPIKSVVVIGLNNGVQSSAVEVTP